MSVDGRRRRLIAFFWRAIPFAVALLVALPIATIFFSWSAWEPEIWRHLWQTQMPRLLLNTFLLLLGVGIGVSCLGVSLAWLTAMCRFPGSRWLDWALMLPLAMPAYVLAFVALDLFDFAGPVQTQMREWWGPGQWLPPIRSRAGVILVLVSVLYPYVYMLARSAFMAQGRELMDAARLLGVTPFRAFFRVALPMARPAIVAGVSLALMETLADFGTVAVFNYDTFTTAIYKSWFGFFNLQAAAQLASLLLLFVGLSLMFEQLSRGRARYEQSERHKPQRYPLRGPVAWLVTSYCCGVLLLAFALPVGRLLQWSLSTVNVIDRHFIALVGHTLLLGAIAALLTAAMALAVSLSLRFYPGRWRQRAARLASMGYALPGSVLAVGVMLSFSYLDRYWQALADALGVQTGPLLMGSIAALLAAYMVRFFTVAMGPIDAGLQRIRPSLQEAAQTLGASQSELATRLYIPMLLPGMLTALSLILVDVMKEMPATLLLRPFGWDTLAVRVYEMTSEGEWERAALPALTLVMVGLLPVVLMMRRSRG